MRGHIAELGQQEARPDGEDQPVRGRRQQNHLPRPNPANTNWLPFMIVALVVMAVIGLFLEEVVTSKKLPLVQLVSTPENLASFSDQYLSKHEVTTKYKFLNESTKGVRQCAMLKVLQPQTSTISIWLLVTEKDFDDRAGRLDKLMTLLMENIRYGEILFDHISIVVLNKTGDIDVEKYLQTYMDYLLETESGDQTHKKSIMRRIISNILITNRFLALPREQKSLNRLLIGAEISSTTYLWLHNNSRDDGFNPVAEILVDIAYQLSSVIRQQTQSLQDHTLINMYESIQRKDVSALMQCLNSYLPHERQRIKLMLKQQRKFQSSWQALKTVVLNAAINIYLTDRLHISNKDRSPHNQNKIINMRAEVLRKYRQQCTAKNGFDQHLCTLEQLVQEILRVDELHWRRQLKQLLATIDSTEL